MKQFPELKENQIAILCSEASTGHVLDVHFTIVQGNEQEVYIVCDSFNEAIERVGLILKGRKDIECVIYGPNQCVLKYISSESDLIS